MKTVLIQSLEEWRDSLSAFRDICPSCDNALKPIEASISEINRLSNELAEKERENARLIRDMVLHEQALEQAMEREEKLREVLARAIRFVDAFEPRSRAAEVDQQETLRLSRDILSNVPHQARTTNGSELAG